MKVRASCLGSGSLLCRRNILFLLAVVLGVVVLIPFTNAQSTGGRLRGTVMDPTGGAVVGAAGTLVNEATHATPEVQSGGKRECAFLAVPGRTYDRGTPSQAPQ